jgi:hypothetical protein
VLSLKNSFLVQFSFVISGDFISSHSLALLLHVKLYTSTISRTVHTSGRAVWRLLLKPLGCLYRGFESRWEVGSSSLVFGVLCRQRPLRLTDYSFRGNLPGVSLCMCLTIHELGTSTMARPRPEMGCCTTEKMSHTNETATWLTNFKLQSTVTHIIWQAYNRVT